MNQRNRMGECGLDVFSSGGNQWRVIVNIAMGLWPAQKARNFGTAEQTMVSQSTRHYIRCFLYLQMLAFMKSD
jgi:hypothetical protein